jgi:hypothetical protein
VLICWYSIHSRTKKKAEILRKSGYWKRALIKDSLTWNPCFYRLISTRDTAEGQIPREIMGFKVHPWPLIAACDPSGWKDNVKENLRIFFW